jgi:aminomuconate-semialdehyde/2-hydroxymuconate-6-semialdehyde dehydrogenase
LPLYLLTWKIAPAIAFGNTVVAKPSEITSLTASLLTEILTSAGVPKGVVNIVFGTGSKAGAAIVSHPQIPLISFTGGTVTGRAIAVACAPLLKKTSFELGGKNANVIFNDCDLDQAIETTIRSSFLNQGEICLCGSRIYVEKSIADKFLDRFTARVRELKVGNPKDEATFLGPVVSSEHHAKVMGFFETAKSESAKILTGGKRPALNGKFANGYFIEPTVITNVKHNSRLQQEEIFGPAVTVTTFGDDKEALELANGVTYGLSATVWTSNLNRAHSFGAKLDVGTVWVNNWMTRDLRVPFGGMKASGVGREGQHGSLEFFTESKTICVRHS